MNKKVEIVLAKYGCLFMKDDNKEMFSEIEEVYKDAQAKQLILSGVSDCNMQDFMLHYQNSKHIFTDKAIDVIKTYKR